MADIWKDYDVEAGQSPIEFMSGRRHVWIQQRNEETWIADRLEDKPPASTGGSAELDEAISWSRWAHKSGSNRLSIRPVFPDLPIVISSEYPLTISSGTRIQIFSRIPVWVRIAFADSSYILKEIPSIELSKTWFGTPLEGELCYWSPTKARRSLDKVESMPYLVNCPIWITNKAAEDLHFEKFCFRVERLGIHRSDNQLWAGETRIVYHGEDANSDISMTGKLPSGLDEGELLSRPRNPIQTSLAVRTFKKLFDDTFISAR